MPRLQLKERQFEPTGNNLGTFGPSDLESFDLTFTDSDEPEKPSGKGPQMPPSRVPAPVDNNPLKKKQEDKPDLHVPDKWDLHGKKLDDDKDDPPDPPQGKGKGNGPGGPEGPGGPGGGGGGGIVRGKPRKLNLDKDDSREGGDDEGEIDDVDNEKPEEPSDLEKALNDIDKKTSDSVKSRQNQEDTDDSRSQKEIDDEAAAAKEILGKAMQDAKSDNLNSGEEDEDDDFEDEILKDLGAGNLTSLFNPGNLKDWRSRLDKLFDKATGFDIITNPNLINKKIEDAPPGREDEDPQLKNIVVLIDLSGSMGSGKFKEVIAHVDTMVKARKLNKVWFHIVAFGDDSIRVLEKRYMKVKGSKFKQTMLTKYSDTPWGTVIVPGLELAATKVHKPDAIIIMTDAEIFDGARELERSPKAKTFVKKYKNKIIWALTSNASLNAIMEIDPTLKAKKRYIKFKRDGKRS